MPNPHACVQGGNDLAQKRPLLAPPFVGFSISPTGTQLKIYKGQLNDVGFLCASRQL